jgi:hypothetical protein
MPHDEKNLSGCGLIRFHSLSIARYKSRKFK